MNLEYVKRNSKISYKIPASLCSLVCSVRKLNYANFDSVPPEIDEKAKGEAEWDLGGTSLRMTYK